MEAGEFKETKEIEEKPRAESGPKLHCETCVEWRVAHNRRGSFRGRVSQLSRAGWRRQGEQKLLQEDQEY